MQQPLFQKDPKQMIVIAVTVEMSYLVQPYNNNSIIFLVFFLM